MAWIKSFFTRFVESTKHVREWARENKSELLGCGATMLVGLCAPRLFGLSMDDGQKWGIPPDVAMQYGTSVARFPNIARCFHELKLLELDQLQPHCYAEMLQHANSMMRLVLVLRELPVLSTFDDYSVYDGYRSGFVGAINTLCNLAIHHTPAKSIRMEEIREILNEEFMHWCIEICGLSTNNVGLYD